MWDLYRMGNELLCVVYGSRDQNNGKTKKQNKKKQKKKKQSNKKKTLKSFFSRWLRECVFHLDGPVIPKSIVCLHRLTFTTHWSISAGDKLVMCFPENRIWHFMLILSIGMSNAVFWKKKENCYKNVVC